MAWVLFITLSLKFSISAWTGIVSPGANPVRGRFTVEESGPEVQHKHPNVFELLRVTGSFMECIWFKSTRALTVINCFVFLSKVKNPFLSSFASIRYLLSIVVGMWLFKVYGKYWILHNVRFDVIQIFVISIPHISVFSFKRAWQVTWKLKREWILMTSGENVATMKKMLCPEIIFQKLEEYWITI